MQNNLPSVGSPLFYGVFFVAVLIMLAIDMLTLKKKGDHRISAKEALSWSIVWVAVSAGFAAWLYWNLSTDPQYGVEVAKDKTLEFFTGYIIEKALAVDNIFVFLMIFSYFKVPPQYQHRVLLYGVFGAIVLRALMVAIGAVLVREFAWILYVFGAFLIFTGIKMMLPGSAHEPDLANNRIVRFIRRFLRVTNKLHGEHFFIIKRGMYFATPMFLVLIMIEISDVIFAVDSIPAIFAVTTDPFIVLTSNIFAILGLRAMYFLLADVADRFHLLKYGLAAVLTFIGTKMLIVEFYHIPVAVSLVVVFGLLLLSIVASLWLPSYKK